MNERVLAVVVCYNPDIAALRLSLLAVTQQQCDILLVDNASENRSDIRLLVNDLLNNQPLLNQQDSSTLAIKIAEQAHNFGLGAAHNIGIRHAQQQDYSYVLLLDQDSVPLEGMVEQLLEAHQHQSKSHKVSAVGATYLNADNGSESFFVCFGRIKFQRQYCAQRDTNGCVEADFLISSGSLIDLKAISDIGIMDEALFIDHVDTEWFLRARSKGYKAYGVCNAVMEHGLGEITHRFSLGGRKRNVPQHKPFRYYYIFRNSVLLYRRSYVSGLWKWNDFQRLCMIMLMFGLLKSPRIKNLRAMLKGINDGVRGVSGAIDADA